MPPVDDRPGRSVGRCQGAKPAGGQGRRTPTGDFGHHAGVPGTARGGQAAGQIGREHRRQQHPPPSSQPCKLRLAADSPEVTGQGGVSMTLNRMYHCVPRIISGLSQISGLEPVDDNERHHHWKQQVGGKRRQEQRQWLDTLISRGRKPIQTPIGTQIRPASTVRTTTRARVLRRPNRKTCATSASLALPQNKTGEQHDVGDRHRAQQPHPPIIQPWIDPPPQSRFGQG